MDFLKLLEKYAEFFPSLQGALARVLDERSAQIPPEFLLPWVPTLVACLLRSDGSKLMNILLNLVKEFPLAVYLPVKCLFQQLNREGGNKRSRTNNAGDEGAAGETFEFSPIFFYF